MANYKFWVSSRQEFASGPLTSNSVKALTAACGKLKHSVTERGGTAWRYIVTVLAAMKTKNVLFGLLKCAAGSALSQPNGWTTV